MNTTANKVNTGVNTFNTIEETANETTAQEYSHAAHCLELYLMNTAEIYERYTTPFIRVAAELIKEYGLSDALELIEDCQDFINPAIGDASRLVKKYDGLTPTHDDWQAVERNYIGYVIECAQFDTANAAKNI